MARIEAGAKVCLQYAPVRFYVCCFSLQKGAALSDELYIRTKVTVWSPSCLFLAIGRNRIAFAYSSAMLMLGSVSQKGQPKPVALARHFVTLQQEQPYRSIDKYLSKPS